MAGYGTVGTDKMARTYSILLLAVALLAQAPRKAAGPQFQTSHRCVACHNGLTASNGEDISIGFDWRPTMMANSARDPYWQAGVRREVMDHPESKALIEDECATCHMPMARYESRQRGHEGAVFAHLPFDPGKQEDRLAADGVSCSLCHQIGKQKLGTRESFVGGFVIDPPAASGERPEYGPYEIDAGLARVMRSSSRGFKPVEAPHIRQSEVCATCHTLITRAIAPDGKLLGEFPEQVPYQEWLHSEYRETRSCQSCHMPPVEGEVPISSVLGKPRAGVARHSFVGGNFFMLGILNRYRGELGVEALPSEMSSAIERTLAHLKSEAAALTLKTAVLSSGRLVFELAVENHGGHKLPTAYPSRRVWLHVTVRDAGGRAVFESGAVEPSGAIRGNDNDADATSFEPHYTEITSEGQVQIYESVMSDSGGRVTTALLHAVRYLKDNRLLPRGFDKQTAGPEIAVAGDAARDDSFKAPGDTVRYSVDLKGAQGPYRIEAELRFQPISYRWAENLKRYDAEETRRFTRYYESMSAQSSTVLASLSATR
jgi:mono/diheme cytochrome c family protein